MKRRVFVQLIAGVIGGCSKISKVVTADDKSKQRLLTFFVSGARFQKPFAGLKVGDRIDIRPDTFKGGRCYSVFAAGEKKLGYVPGKLVPMFDDTDRLEARLSVVDQFGVPWKRYEVKVLGVFVEDKAGLHQPPATV